jgi:hypothetical protein
MTGCDPQTPSSAHRRHRSQINVTLTSKLHPTYKKTPEGEPAMSATKPTDKSRGTSTDEHAPLRQQLIELLHGGQAHATFDEVIKDFPANLRGTVPPNLPYSAWQLLEHLRISQRDILNFSAPPTGGYHPMRWPQDYWPQSPEPPTDEAWNRSIQVIHADLKTFIALIENPQSDLFKPFRWGDGQNLLREALLIADHNAYHIGELIVLRRLLGAWNN